VSFAPRFSSLLPSPTVQIARTNKQDAPRRISHSPHLRGLVAYVGEKSQVAEESPRISLDGERIPYGVGDLRPRKKDTQWALLARQLVHGLALDEFGPICHMFVPIQDVHGATVSAQSCQQSAHLKSHLNKIKKKCS